MNGVKTFWLTVMNVALGVAVLASMLVVAVSLIEEFWIRHPALLRHWPVHTFHGHPGRIRGRHR